MPFATNTPMILYIAKNIIKKPDVFKNSLEFFPSIIFFDPTVIKRSIGRVPNENTSIVSAPSTKEPETTAFNCIACVKPQGSKKVAIPSSIGVNIVLLPILSNMLVDSFLGSVSSNRLNHGDMSMRFIANTSMMKKRITPIMISIVLEMTINEPIAPSNPPSMKKDITLEI